MFKIRNVVMAAAVMLALVGLATTSSAAYVQSNGGTSASYHVYGDFGELWLEGPEGAPFNVFDIAGNPVAQGVMQAGGVSMMTPHGGIAADGTALYVLLDRDILAATTDPDWQWD